MILESLFKNPCNSGINIQVLHVSLTPCHLEKNVSLNIEKSFNDFCIDALLISASEGMVNFYNPGGKIMYTYSVIQWLFFFYFYCFVGWCIESA